MADAMDLDPHPAENPTSPASAAVLASASANDDVLPPYVETEGLEKQDRATAKCNTHRLPDGGRGLKLKPKPGPGSTGYATKTPCNLIICWYCQIHHDDLNEHFESCEDPRCKSYIHHRDNGTLEEFKRPAKGSPSGIPCKRAASDSPAAPEDDAAPLPSPAQLQSVQQAQEADNSFIWRLDQPHMQISMTTVANDPVMWEDFLASLQVGVATVISIPNDSLPDGGLPPDDSNHPLVVPYKVDPRIHAALQGEPLPEDRRLVVTESHSHGPDGEPRTTRDYEDVSTAELEKILELRRGGAGATEGAEHMNKRSRTQDRAQPTHDPQHSSLDPLPRSASGGQTIPRLPSARPVALYDPDYPHGMEDRDDEDNDPLPYHPERSTLHLSAYLPYDPERPSRRSPDYDPETTPLIRDREANGGRGPAIGPTPLTSLGQSNQRTLRRSEVRSNTSARRSAIRVPRLRNPNPPMYLPSQIVDGDPLYPDDNDDNALDPDITSLFVPAAASDARPPTRDPTRTALFSGIDSRTLDPHFTRFGPSNAAAREAADANRRAIRSTPLFSRGVRAERETEEVVRRYETSHRAESTRVRAAQRLARANQQRQREIEEEVSAGAEAEALDGEWEESEEDDDIYEE